MTATLVTVPVGDEALLDGREVSRRLGVTYETLLRWRKEGRVPGVKISRKVVRFSLSQVAKALGIEVVEGMVNA